MTDEIVCPYCGEEMDAQSEQIGEMLYLMKTECNNFLTCLDCDKEFEVCVQVEYRYGTHKKSVVDDADD